MKNLQNALTEAVVSGNYPDIARVMGEMNRENAKQYCEHNFVRLEGKDGWPGGQRCRKCAAQTPEVFCRTPHKCCEAGRCMSEIACND